MSKRKLILSFLLIIGTSSTLLAQIKVVTGKVTDDKGIPIPGVNIVIKKTNKSTTGDFDGNYRMEAQKGDVLVFAFLGFNNRELTVGTEAIMNATLTENTEKLNEVVVVGYGSMRKKDLTGAIVSIKPSQDDAAIATSIFDLLQGKAAGVTVSSGGSTPGSAGSVTIRGANSLQGDSQPLYVIDNVPQSSTGQTMGNSSGDYQSNLDPLAGINPNDIEDIQILKDASATAIYGSRGANGVILITTKKGKEGKAIVRASAIYSIAEASKFLDVMNLQEYGTYWNAKYPNDQRFIFENNTIKYQYTGKDANGQDILRADAITDKNWQDIVTKPGVSQEYNLNISGGSKATKYSFSTSYKNVEGIVKNTGLKHGDIRLNLNTDVSEKLSFGVQFSGFLRKNNMMSGGNTVGRVSGALIPTAVNTAPFERPTDDITFANDVDSRTTVFSWLTDYDDISNEYRFSTSLNLDYKITKGLKYTFRTGGNLNNVERSNWYDLGIYNGYLNNGYLNQNRLQRNNYNVENLLFYNTTIGIARIDATAGITYDAYQTLNTGAIGKNFPYKNLRSDGIHTATSVQIINPVQNDYQLFSYLARVNASLYNGKYVLTGSIRADGTSKFSEENKWGYFPSVAVAWNVNQESFLADNEWLSQFKVRSGYGATGSQNIAPYSTLFGYGAVGLGYATGSGAQIPGLGVNGITNPNLKWESTESINAGVDFGFLNDRISGAVDLYQKTTKDLLVDIALPGSTAYSVLTVNRGEIENKGIEAALNIDLIRQKDLKWSIGGNIAFNQSTINKIGSAPGSFGSLGKVSAFLGNTAGDHFGAVNIFIEGEAPGLFYGFKTDGIVQQDDTYKVGNPFGNSATPGNIKVVDVNGDGTVDLADKTIIGDPNPDYTFGFQTSLNYKQFRFKTSFAGVKGGDILNSNNRYINLANYQSGDRNMNPNAIANAWTATNASNQYPSISSNVVSGHIYDRYLEDGSYLRCNDITLGYTFKEDIVGNFGLSSFDLFLSATNPFTISNYSGYDPTSRSFNFDPLRRGMDLYSFPAQRQIIIGVNLTF
ncbi:SusC/RagA family TonB-linked outer membrane protein [Flavobacterium sp. TMP13]|uniref:SusC/RagA family TonB-linked outer membrane protein n=1 Tax=Flavobacterium sp. TMP13 TaxID=3425950 RepID=UPI003D76B568